MMLISLVDDDPLYQFILKRQIANSGVPARLLQFHDGMEALDYFISNQTDTVNLPDLVLLDINMPYIDGWQFLDEIAKIDLAKKNIRIYIVSSSDSIADQQRAMTYNSLAGYLCKPMTIEKFLKIIDTF